MFFVYTRLMRKYDLTERTAVFGETVIDLMREIKRTDFEKPVFEQLIRSSTSIGANYMEADVAESKRDFIHKLGIARKETKETLYWIRLIAHLYPEKRDICRLIYKEGVELAKIFSTIILKTKSGVQ